MRYRISFFVIFMSLVVLVPHLFAEEQGDESKIEELGFYYKEMESTFKDYKAEAERLTKAGRGDIAFNVEFKALANKISFLKDELEELERELMQLSEAGLPKLPPSEIARTANKKGASPKGGLVNSGDRLEFGAKGKRPIPGVKIKKIVLTADPKDQNGRKFLYHDEQPFIFIYYDLAEGVGKVHVIITVKDLKSGKMIITKNTERKRKEGASLQRVGFGLKKGRIKPDSGAIFDVFIATTPGGQAESSSVSFKVQYYDITLALPDSLKSEEEVMYRILVPPSFKAPFDVDMAISGEISLSGADDSLSGSIYGLKTEKPELAQIWAKVTDIDGRIGKAAVAVTVTPEAKLRPAGEGSTHSAEVEPGTLDTPPPNPQPESEVTITSPPQSIEDYIVLGKKKYREWAIDWIKHVYPSCMQNVVDKLVNAVGKLSLPDKEAKSYAMGAKFFIEEKFKGDFLRPVIGSLRNLPYNDCTVSFVEKISIEAATSMLTSEHSSSFSQKVIAEMKQNSEKE